MNNPLVINGKYAQAKVFADVFEREALDQIQTLVNQPFVEGEDIAIMPDVHAGAGCTIGYTQTLRSGRICANLVGVDISCGLLTVKLGKLFINTCWSKCS